MAASGRSVVPETLAFEYYVRDLAGLVSKLGSGKVHLVGHSMGSIVCQHYAQQHLDKVASMTLLGGFTAPPDAARNALRVRAGSAREKNMADIATAIATNGTVKAVQEHQPAAEAFVRESLLAQSPEGYLHARLYNFCDKENLAGLCVKGCAEYELLKRHIQKI